MSGTAFPDLDTRLKQFERRLQAHIDILDERGVLSPEHSERIAELDEKARQVRFRLDSKLAQACGVDWELLKLELQNDLLLLTRSFSDWSRHLDRRFRAHR